MSDFYAIRSALSRIDECGCEGSEVEAQVVAQDQTGPQMVFSISYTTQDGSTVSLAVADLQDFVKKANAVRIDPSITSYHMNISESK